MTIGCGEPFCAAARPTALSSVHVRGGGTPSDSSTRLRYQNPATFANGEMPKVRPL